MWRPPGDKRGSRKRPANKMPLETVDNEWIYREEFHWIFATYRQSTSCKKLKSVEHICFYSHLCAGGTGQWCIDRGEAV